MSSLPTARSLLVTGARLVPVAGVPAPPGEVCLRIAGGVVTDVAPSLSPLPDEAYVDAAGRFAIPGLWDHHVHLGQWGRSRTRLDLSGTTSAADATARVAHHVAELPAGSDGIVVVGFGHRSAGWPTPPTVRELDLVSAGHPVILVSGDAHNGWLNTRAQRLLGVPPVDTALDEDDWFPVYARLADLPGASQDEIAAYRAAVAAAAALGVVGVTDLEWEPGFRRWPGRVAAGVDTLRVRTGTYAEHLGDVVADGLGTGDPLPGAAGMVAMGPLKIISDGSINTRTAHCCEPYADSDRLAFPRGKQNTSPDELRALLATATAHRLEAAVHAIGDAAVDIALDAFEATGARGRVEHAQLMRRESVLRMARIGIRASVQPAHLLDDRDVTELLWPDRCDRVFMFRALLDAGVPLAFGSDAPVSPLDPWLAMAAAVHRSADDREPWHGEQAVTAAEALAASTDGQGTVRAGSRGDVVLLDADPLGGSGSTAEVAAHLRTLRAATTIVGGRVVHDARRPLTRP